MNPTTTTTTASVREQWLHQRLALLEREKALSRLSDELAEARRALPWVRMDKRYVFDTPQGPRALGDLFEGRSQLLVQHFMLGPGWEQGCRSCSYMADHTDGMLPHLAARDVAFVAVSRAPLAEIERFRRRMGWNFRWVSSHGSDFNRDFGVSFTPDEVAAQSMRYNFAQQPYANDEMPGVSVFAKNDAGEVFHTYSTYGRGVEVMMGTYRLLDLTPRGRQEEGLDDTMSWVRHHDRYADRPAVKGGSSCCGSHA
ncbi:MAG TPA: thioredoxin family protein [Hydrogenophaga sp.]|uniref:DUF899 domain-containing protein n=1 Tax=Hydrogenophaga sp. TaxID=1904254 RepID=UPI002BA4A8D7|nr:thioredoxin family protein [Hydrogenophaga sp.]HSX94181.1 thioredoxin family protein [Hydrogenophaga sp.]